MSQFEILIKSLSPAHDQGNLRGFATIKVGEITIHDCRIIQQPGSRAYVSGPQKQVGQRYYPLVTMSAALRDRVQMEVLEAAKKGGLITEI